MNIVRKIHDQFRVKTLAGSTLQSPTSTSDSTGSGNTYVTITGGSLGGGGLSEADRSKLNSIEQGAQVNQDAFSKVLLETTNREQEQQTTTSSSIIANIPSDTANIRLVGNYPIKVSLESVSLFNYNTVTTTGDIVATYNVSYNKDGNIVIDYVSGTLFSTTDIEIIRIQHREETLATYNNTQFECTESEGTIIQFIIPYQGTDFSSIQFCRYETSSSESTEGTETVRELSVITELPVSPTKQQIITLSDTNANYWKYEEDENGNRYLWTDCNVYSTKEVSAYGKAEGQEMPTILNLSQLQDVALTNLSNNQVLVYNASSQKWVNIDANNLGISADNLKTLTITVNGTSYTYNPASSNQSINITTITLDDILPYISNKLDREEFFKWFTINYDSDNNVTSIQANYDFYSIKGISAYGLGDIGGITRTTLQSLDDVSLSNLVADNMLAYNGSKWVNIPMSQVRGVTSWADLENKPTTISGFGITDVYTKTEIDNKLSPINSSITSINSSKANSSIQIIAGTGLVGGGDLTANRTISLSTSGVSAGTYTKVTVDTYGRVTSGSTLSATDIPDLDWSKITSGKPTTLEGYGITDGVNSITITGSGNAITAVTISNHLLTFTKGETFLLKSTFDDLFEKVNVGTTSNPVYAIKAKYHLYSVGEVSAYEFGETGGTGVSSLEELIDVQLTNLVADSILKYNGTKWINIPINEIKGATSWSEIEDKPSTFTPSAHTHTVADITNISPLTLNVNGSSLFTYDGKSSITANLTVPTKVSQLTNDTGFITGISSSMVTSALGYTPYNSTNPNGYISGITKAMVEGVLTGNITSHTHSYLPLSGGTMVKNARISHNGNLYIGSSSNSGWVALQDICSQNSIGDGIWSIRTNGDAIFTTIKKVGSSNSYVLLGGGGHKLVSDFAISGHNHYRIKLSDDRAKYPGQLAGNETMSTFGGFMQNSILGISNFGNYSDVLVIRSYSDSSGGNDNAIIFNKNTRGVWHTQFGFGSTTSWGTPYLFLDSNNFNKYTPTLTGTGASGTWGISITGNASTATTASKLGTATIGSGVVPIYLNVGTATASTVTLGGTAKPIYLNAGTMTALSATVGSSSLPVYLSTGTITPCSTTLGVSITGNAATSSKLNSITVHPFSSIAFNYRKFASINITQRFVGAAALLLLTWSFTSTNERGNSCKVYINAYQQDAIGNSPRYNIETDCDDRWFVVYAVLNYTSAASTIDLYAYGKGVSYSGINVSLLSGDNIIDIGDALSSLPSGTVITPKKYGSVYSAFTASVLTTTRTLWGQSFNGTANVSGDLTGVGHIYMTSRASYIYNKNNQRVLVADYRYTILGYGTAGAGLPTYIDGSPIYMRCGTSYIEALTIINNGNVGIGTNSPSVKLHVAGDIAATGEVTAKASSSDIRLKTDISDYKALSIIRSHKSIKYHWNAVAKANADVFNDDYWHYGLIAQDVQRDMPQMVSDVFKDYLVINYERLIPICWKGLQEVDDEVTKLKKRVKQLEKRLQKYESTEVFYAKGND